MGSRWIHLRQCSKLIALFGPILKATPTDPHYRSKLDGRVAVASCFRSVLYKKCTRIISSVKPSLK